MPLIRIFQSLKAYFLNVDQYFAWTGAQDSNGVRRLQNFKTFGTENSNRTASDVHTNANGTDGEPLHSQTDPEKISQSKETLKGPDTLVENQKKETTMSNIQLKNKTNTVTGANIATGSYQIISKVLDTNSEFFLLKPGNSPEKDISKRNIICHCSKFVSLSPTKPSDHEELDKIDPISGLTNRETIFKRHPNLGRQVLSEAPRCNLIPYITK